MNDPVVIIGIGEIGGVFSRGLLRTGIPVYPVLRAMDMGRCAADIPAPRLVVVAVGEKDLHPVLEQIPEQWRDRLALLQNELLPRDWIQHKLRDPTIISVWFEKKPGQEAKVVVPSPVYGPGAWLLIDALEILHISSWELATEEELLFELVRKNLYILTTNIAGLQVGGDVDGLWQEHQDVAQAVVEDVLAIQTHLTGHKLDRDRLIAAMVTAFEGDPQHKCMGRSAPVRLERALEIAKSAQIAVPTLQQIRDETRSP